MKSAGTANRLARLAAWLVFAWGTLLLLMLPVRRYDWMQQMDSAISAPDGADNATLFALLLLSAIVASQVAIITLAKSHRERTCALLLALAAIALWAARFWR